MKRNCISMARTKHKLSCASLGAREAGGILIAQGEASKASGTLGMRSPLNFRARFSGRQTFAAKNICRPFGADHHSYAEYPGLTPGATLCRRLRRLVVAILITGFLSTVTT